MPSAIYLYLIDLGVSLLISRGPGEFINVLVLEHRALKTRFFNVTMFTVLTAVLLLP
jgi:hypothetical protein